MEQILVSPLLKRLFKLDKVSDAYFFVANGHFLSYFVFIALCFREKRVKNVQIYPWICIKKIKKFGHEDYFLGKK